MIWHKLTKRVDAPGVIPAPLLIVLSVLLVGVIAWKENALSNQEKAAQHVIIELEQDTVEEVENQSEIPEMVRQAVDAFMAEAKGKRIDVEALHDFALYKSLDKDNQIDFISFAGRAMVRGNRHDEALEILGLISKEQMLAHGSAFAFASALSKEGRYAEALNVYEANHKASPEHQAGAFNYGLMLARFDRHEDASTILAYSASISSGSLRGKSLSAQAVELLALGRLEQAIAALKKSIEYRPTSSGAWLKLANAYMLSSKVSQQEVIETYTKASALAPSKYRPVYDWANYLFAVGRFREAIPLYVRANRLAKDRFDIMFSRVLNLYISGRTSSAKRVLKRLNKQGISRSQKVLTSLIKAIIGREKKVIRSGVSKLKKSKKISSSMYQYLLLLSALERNEPTKVAEILQRSPENSLYRLPMQYSYARELYKDKHYSEAADVFMAVSVESPKSSQFRYNYARALSQLNKQDEALIEFAEAYGLEPHSKRISLEYSKLLVDMEKSDKAIEILESLLSIYPRYSKAMLQLAQIHTAMNDDLGAIEYLKQALALDDANSEISLKLIQAQIALGLFEEALDATDEILTINSGLIEARMFRASLLSNLGNIQECNAEIDRILSLDPNYQPALKLRESLAAKPEKSSND